MNPYQSPTAIPARIDVGSRVGRDSGPLVITAILILAVVIGLLSILVPAIRAATMPRFGWIGLLLCLNPLILLAHWFMTRKRRKLLAASFLTCMIGLVNAMEIFSTGTVSLVQNVFLDRLHSSWLWAVLPFFVAGGYLCWRAFANESDVRDTDGGTSKDLTLRSEGETQR